MDSTSSLHSVIEDLEDLRQREGEQIREAIVSTIYQQAETIAQKVVQRTEKPAKDWDGMIDDVVTSRALGIPLMLLLLGGVFWLTIVGSNYPSQILNHILFTIEDYLSTLVLALGAPPWFHGLAILGVYRGLAWVVSVMLPPMAIFFPLFTLFEDLGYLPRIAFNLDGTFKRVGAHGKQALTMAMGFGCNAAGIIAARIIDSPRERLIAILTNNFVPCNGRFPILISMAAIIAGLGTTNGGALTATIMIVGIIMAGVAMTFFVSWGLSRTLLKGEPSSFTLELPPYRKPQILRVIIRSFFDRTIFVLSRAIMVAAPAGAITWALANIYVGHLSLIGHLASWLNPLGQLMGLDGMILLAFILGLPANEIVIPILMMGYLSAGAMLELDGLQAMQALLLTHGWTWLTALNFMLFALMHFPCGTTLLTIKKETGSRSWTILAALIPTAMGITTCIFTAQLARFLHLV